MSLGSLGKQTSIQLQKKRVRFKEKRTLLLFVLDLNQGPSD